MVSVITLNYNSFRMRYEPGEREWANNYYLFYSQVEAHVSAVEELLDYLQFKLEQGGKRKTNPRVAEFNYKEFVDECKKEFIARANAYVDIMDQQAYIDGICRTLTALKKALLNVCKANEQEIGDNTLPSLCIIWK